MKSETPLPVSCPVAASKQRKPTKTWISRSGSHAVLIVCLLILAGGLRLIDLGKRGYWHDEAYTSLRAAGFTGGEFVNAISDKPFAKISDLMYFQNIGPGKTTLDTLRSAASSDPHITPLYLIMSRYWMMLMGESAAAMRSLAVVIGLFAIVGCYWLAMELFRSREPSLLAAAFMSISPIHILLSREARMYSLLTFATLISSAAFLRALRVNTRSAWALYAATVIVGLYSHLLFVPVVIVHAIYLYISSIERADQSQQHARFGMAAGVAAICFIPWLWVMVYYNVRLRNMEWVSEPLPIWRMKEIWYDRFGSVFFDWLPPSEITRFAILLPVFLFVLYAFYFTGRHRSMRTILFLVMLTLCTWAPLAGLDFILGGKRSTVARYLTPGYVGMLFPVAFLLATKLKEPALSRRLTWGTITVVLASLALASDYKLLRADSWWDKNQDVYVSNMVYVINQSQCPLLVVTGKSATDPGNTLSLAHQLSVHVHIKWGVQELRSLGAAYSDVYIMLPTREIRDEFGDENLTLVDGRMLWKLKLLPQERRQTHCSATDVPIN